MSDKIATTDAHEIVMHVEGTEDTRPVTASLYIGIQGELDRLFKITQYGVGAALPLRVSGGNINLPFVSVADVFMELQSALGEELAQNVGDERVGADDVFAIIACVR